MKKLALITAAVLISAPAMADDVFGTWKTNPDDNGNSGHIKISQCGEKICGVLVKSFNPEGNVYKSESDGKKIIWDMVNQGSGAYGGGKIWTPDRDKTYRSNMLLNGNNLTVKGCISVICRTGGKWTRVN